MIAPLLATPPQLTDPVSGTRVWFFQQQRVMVDQTVGNLSVEVARFLTGELEAELQRRWVKGGQKVRYVHDWRSAVTYDAKAREMVLDWGRASRAHAEQIVLHMSPDASPFIRIAAQTGVNLLRVTRMNVELVDSLEPVLKELSAYTPG